jgi:hypothetical protein
MIDLSRRYLFYGRVEPKLFGTDRRHSKSEGYQVIRHSPEIEPSLLSKMEECISFNSQNNNDFWTEMGDAHPDLWSFAMLGAGFFAIAKTVFWRNTELLDQRNRPCPISQVVVLNDAEMHYLENNPFLLIDADESPFLSSIEELEDLAQSPDSDIPFLKSFERSGLEVDDSSDLQDEEYSSEILMDIIASLEFGEGKAMISGKSSQFLDFMRSLHHVVGIEHRKKCTFSQLVSSQRQIPFRFQAGHRAYGCAFINTSERSFTAPEKNGRNRFFFDSWLRKSRQATVAKFTERIDSASQLCSFLKKDELDLDEIDSIKPKLIENYFEYNRKLINEDAFNALKTLFPLDLANQLVDYSWHADENPQKQLRRLQVCEKCESNRHLVIELVREFCLEQSTRVESFLDKPAWRSILALAQENDDNLLIFIVATVGLPNEKLRMKTLDLLSEKCLREAMIFFQHLPPSTFLCSAHWQYVLSQFQPMPYSDSEIVDFLLSLKKYGASTLGGMLLERVGRMSTSNQSILRRKGNISS